ncbi:MAG: low molecular weight phosphotyrosine protein phosphatase [Gammaproteobacteria bacterium]|jgi:protein-tyrosine phosphatase|nr:low molecular weight phosphotyrosine protein phosphatase [Gammaproteobacteria bacterium]MBQ0774136.1 low molecular weight phosphotyrosine protein phosphatase [Gammaproteobacteria bacterium]
MFSSILFVCDGNICRSPTAEFLMQKACPHQHVASAGLVGLVGKDMAPIAREVAREQGVECPVHVAQKLTEELCREFDLVLVMEKRQRDDVMRNYPSVSGKVFLLTHWSGGKDIPDPWRRDKEVYQYAFKLMYDGVQAWGKKLG